MITCGRFDNCKVIGVVPERVKRGYHACRHTGVNKNGKTCQFVDFPEVDLDQANCDILLGRTRAHELARVRKERAGVGVLRCGVCGKRIPEKEREFAELWEAHPGILGPIHPACYERAVEERPDLPWTDPISGQVDYREMSEALGFSDPETDFEEEVYQ